MATNDEEATPSTTDESAAYVATPLLLTFGGWTVAAALCGIVGTVRFFTNDDVAMTSFASGSYAGSPGAHLVYVGFLPGLLL